MQEKKRIKLFVMKSAKESAKVFVEREKAFLYKLLEREPPDHIEDRLRERLHRLEAF